MKLKNVFKILSMVVIFMLIAGSTVFAQRSVWDFWVKVKDDAAAGDTLFMMFGNAPNATYCNMDTIYPNSYTYFTTPLVEVQGPPYGLGFESRWTTISSRTACTWDVDLLQYDFRDTMNASKRDTFKLKFQVDNTTANYIMHWPNAAFIGDRCDSLVIKYTDYDIDLNPVPVRINMSTVDSLVIETPKAKGISFVTIYRFGPYKVTDVKQEGSTIPNGFALHASYPNPFNPSTTMKFDVQKSSFTDVSVFNLLGQKVATLVSQELTPGTYSATWNSITSQGTPASTGIYYVRMTARTSNGKPEEFSALQKLLLIK